jgi:hypothetical protein
MLVSCFARPVFTALLLVAFTLVSRPGECRSELQIHALPLSSVERVTYLGHGSFEITLASASSTASGKPEYFFDGRPTLSFVIVADAIDGTLIEQSKAGSAEMRTDSKLGGTAFVNLLISKAASRANVALSVAFLPLAGDRGRDVYRLMYFQVNGT